MTADTNVTKKTAYELGHLIKDKQLSSPELTRLYLDAAKQDFNKSAGDETKLNAYTEVLEESALKAAAEVQAKIDAGENLSPIAGVPVAIKDNICTTEGHTTAASKILTGYQSPFDAGVVEMLKTAGAIILGKTNMDEFAMGSSNEHSCYGPVRNPLNLSRLSGGSSGGSAAAVAGGLAPYALGSDTGGSVRQPAAFCGLTGIKPTHGSISRYGLIAHASSMDQIGPLAKDARDASIILSVISGRDKNDMSYCPKHVEILGLPLPFKPCGIVHPKEGDRGLSGIRIGLPEKHLELTELRQDIKACILNTAETLRGLGAEIVKIELPPLKDVLAAHFVLACAEATSNLARYDGIKYGWRAENAITIEEVYAKTRGQGFGKEVLSRILFGYFALSAQNFEPYYRKSQEARIPITVAYNKALANCDAILTPVSPVSPPVLGETAISPEQNYLSDIYLAPASFTGLPAVSAPCGFDEDGLPIGMQLIGKEFCDMELLDIVFRYQQAQGGGH